MGIIIYSYKFLLLILLGGMGDSDAVHDFHLSKLDVHYKTEQKALQLTVHTFIDDTEAALKSRNDLEYKFFESIEHSLTDSLFAAYLAEHLQIKINGELVQLGYLGKEQSDDIQGVYSYLEIENLDTVTELEISNSILMDQFDDQKNIISILKDDKREAFHILNKGDYSKTISF